MKRILTAIIATAAMLGLAKELALPAVPSDLRIPALRADYIGAHFWDAMDWTDSMATDPAAMTQNVANCLSVFPHMSGDSARVAAADTFVARALRAGENSALAASQAIEDCLFASGSELRDEMLYTVFLERMLAAGYPDSARASYMLEMTRKNMPALRLPTLPLLTATVRNRPSSALPTALQCCFSTTPDATTVTTSLWRWPTTRY